MDNLAGVQVGQGLEEATDHGLGLGFGIGIPRVQVTPTAQFQENVQAEFVTVGFQATDNVGMIQILENFNYRVCVFVCEYILYECIGRTRDNETPT